MSTTAHAPITAPRGTALSCRGWQQEAALRMLMNNLDPEVAERPEELIVYGGAGKAARNWECYERIVETLRRLENDETLLVQSGKPVGVFRTHEEAPRVLIANAHLVPRWATWDEFRRLEELGLTMYGQMTAGSWIYIGTQGILQGTYETFAECARQHFGGTLAGRLVVTAGLGGMGGAQPLAVTMNGGAFLGVEVDPARIDAGSTPATATGWRPIWTRRCASWTAAHAAKQPRCRSGLVGNIAEVMPELVRRGIVPDVVTDQTSAHDLRLGYIPAGLQLDRGGRAAREATRGVREAGARLDGRARRAMLELQERGAVVFDYGNNLRGQVADRRGHAEPSRFPGFVPAFIRPLFCQGSGPFRWAALSGDPEDIAATDQAILERSPRRSAAPLDPAGAEKVHFQGLPARICWLEYGERAEAGLRFNWLVRRREGEGAARDRQRPSGRRLGGVAQPRDRGHEGRLRRHRRLAAAQRHAQHGLRRQLGVDPPRRRRRHRLLDPRRHGVRGRRDRERRRRLERVLTADPGTGVMRHADAGYEQAIETARERGVDLPMLT